MRNAYGTTIEQHLLPGTPRPLSDAQYSDALAAALSNSHDADSDGDGASNLEEINAGSLPGDLASKPGSPLCPAPGLNPRYAVCQYDRRYTFRKVGLDFCGAPPTFDEVESFAALDENAQTARIDEKLAACLDSEFWIAKNGQLWQLANRKIRPLGSFKSGPEDRGTIPVADYDHDYQLYVYSQIDDHDARAVLTAEFHVRREVSPTTSYQAMDAAQEAAEFGGGLGDFEGVIRSERAGLLTSRWTLLYTVMFAVLPRGAAAQAVRAFLGVDIAKMEGLFPVAGEPVDYDNKGVAAPTCAVCHSTLDPLAYPFQNLNGFGAAGIRGTYVANRMDFYESLYPGISQMPEGGAVLGVPVANLKDWAQVAANSDAFARASVTDFWKLLTGDEPAPEYAEQYARLWQDFKGTNNYSTEKMLKAFVRTEVYGAP